MVTRRGWTLLTALAVPVVILLFLSIFNAKWYWHWRLLREAPLGTPFAAVLEYCETTYGSCVDRSSVSSDGELVEPGVSGRVAEIHHWFRATTWLEANWEFDAKGQLTGVKVTSATTNPLPE